MESVPHGQARGRQRAVFVVLPSVPNFAIFTSPIFTGFSTVAEIYKTFKMQFNGLQGHFKGKNRTSRAEVPQESETSMA
jgi:hypothetical protein